jgi:D-arabinose 1-dehydrogenase-like Zn-dependent alcohol dehydrogenase
MKGANLIFHDTVGSAAAHPQSTNDMLKFAARHGIKPMIERFPMSKQGLTDAMARLDEGTLRYRAVLEV